MCLSLNTRRNNRSSESVTQGARQNIQVVGNPRLVWDHNPRKNTKPSESDSKGSEADPLRSQENSRHSSRATNFENPNPGTREYSVRRGKNPGIRRNLSKKSLRKRSCRIGKNDATPARKEREKRQWPREANPTRAWKNNKHTETEKQVREQARTEDTDSGNHQRTEHAQGPVSRSRARFPGEGRMRCAAQS